MAHREFSLVPTMRAQADQKPHRKEAEQRVFVVDGLKTNLVGLPVITTLSQQLQLDAELILKKAKKRIRQKKAVGEHRRNSRLQWKERPDVKSSVFARSPRRDSTRTLCENFPQNCPRVFRGCREGP